MRKHAGATRVLVAVESGEEQLRLLVADDGAGFDPGAERPRQGPRFGLKTMEERAAALGASLAIESKPGEGARLEVVLPLTDGAYSGGNRDAIAPG